MKLLVKRLPLLYCMFHWIRVQDWQQNNSTAISRKRVRTYCGPDCLYRLWRRHTQQTAARTKTSRTRITMNTMNTSDRSQSARVPYWEPPVAMPAKERLWWYSKGVTTRMCKNNAISFELLCCLTNIKSMGPAWGTPSQHLTAYFPAMPCMTQTLSVLILSYKACLIQHTKTVIKQWPYLAQLIHNSVTKKSKCEISTSSITAKNLIRVS